MISMKYTVNQLLFASVTYSRDSLQPPRRKCILPWTSLCRMGFIYSKACSKKQIAVNLFIFGKWQNIVVANNSWFTLTPSFISHAFMTWPKKSYFRCFLKHVNSFKSLFRFNRRKYSAIDCSITCFTYK